MLSREQCEDLREYAEKRQVMLGNYKYSGADIDLIKELIDAAWEVLRVVSELKGTGRKLFTIWLCDMSDGDFAEVKKSAPHILRLNEKYARDKELLKSDYKNEADKGKFVRGTVYLSVVYHEMGHMHEFRNGYVAFAIINKR